MNFKFFYIHLVEIETNSDKETMDCLLFWSGYFLSTALNFSSANDKEIQV